MKRAYATMVALALLVPAGARAQVPDLCGTASVLEGPFAFARVGDVCTDLSDLIVLDQTTGLFNLQVRQLTIGTGFINDLNATFKQDPYITFGASSSNLTAGPTAYTFYFGTLIDPGFYGRASSTGSVSVTRGSGDASVTQNGGEEFINGFGTNGATLVPLGVDIGTGSCNAGAASNTCEYPPPNGGPLFNNFTPVFLDNLELTLTYTQTGLASQVGFTGRVEVYETVIPEPATVTLLLTGLATLAGITYRRRPSA